MTQKEFAKPHSQIQNVFEKEITNSRHHLCSLIRKYKLFPYTDRWMAESSAALISAEYHISRQNISILFCKHFVNIWEWGLAKSFREYMNWKLFGVWSPILYVSVK